MFEKKTLDLARATETLLRRHGRDIIEKQFAMKRLAETVIDLFVGMCVLSRVSKILEEEGPERGEKPLAIARVFSRQADRRIGQNLEQIETRQSEDEEMKALSDFIVDEKRYPWDLV